MCECWLEKLEEIRQALRESGYRFRNREEIDAQIQAERDDWELSVLGPVSDRARTTSGLAVARPAVNSGEPSETSHSFSLIRSFLIR